MTSKKIVPEDSSIVNQDVVSVKDVGGIDVLEFFSDDVNVEETVAGIKELEFSNVNDKNSSTFVSDIEGLVVKEKKELKNINKFSAAVTDSDLNDEKIIFLWMIKLLE